MSKLNVNLNLSAYQDSNPTNNPMQNVIRWSRQISGFAVSDPADQVLSVAPGETKSLFSGSVALNQDNTTEYDLTLKSGTSSTYVLKHAGGTAPLFRAVRDLDSDATTEISISRSGNLATLSHTGGTDPNFSANVNPGDYIYVGAPFNDGNRGVFKILSVSASSISVENANAIAETVVLGVDFADIFRAYGAAGVQVGDRVILGADFLLAAGTYDITHAQDNLIEFYFTGALPEFSSLLSNDVEVYSTSKKMVYVESSKKVSLIVNGVTQEIEPLGSNPALFMLSGTIRSLSVVNSGSESSQIYIASVE